MYESNYLGAANSDSAGLVEIGDLPRMFYTPNYGAPDMLFHALLASAREAYAATASPQKQEFTPPDAGFSAETYMAGLLLRDENFVPARNLRNYSHHYTLHFASGIIHLSTELYSAQQSSAALFSVKLEGRILDSAFVVRHATTNRVLAQVSEGQQDFTSVAP